MSNWLNLTARLSLSAPSRVPNSGAFRSLHCLIYKVLARAAQRRNSCYLITSGSVCQVLFSTFFKIFFALSFPNRLSLRQLGYYIRPSGVCQVLFSSFLKTFSGPAAPGVSASDSLLILADSNPFVKYFSRLFSNFFPSARRPQHSRAGQLD